VAATLTSELLQSHTPPPRALFTDLCLQDGARAGDVLRSLSTGFRHHGLEFKSVFNHESFKVLLVHSMTAYRQSKHTAPVALNFGTGGHEESASRPGSFIPGIKPGIS
jgi:hypothetical protein